MEYSTLHDQCSCKEGFTPTMIPCPEGRVGCCVAHYDASSYICSKCGFDYGDLFSKALLEGRVHTEIGLAVVNINAINKLSLS